MPRIENPKEPIRPTMPPTEGKAAAMRTEMQM